MRRALEHGGLEPSSTGARGPRDAPMAAGIVASTASPSFSSERCARSRTCRTRLGGHRETCDRCVRRGSRITPPQPALPKCQTLTKERWLAARRADLLPTSVFSRRLHAAARPQCPRPGQSARDLRALVRAAADTLLAFGQDARISAARSGHAILQRGARRSAAISICTAS